MHAIEKAASTFSHWTLDFGMVDEYHATRTQLTSFLWAESGLSIGNAATRDIGHRVADVPTEKLFGFRVAATAR